MTFKNFEFRGGTSLTRIESIAIAVRKASHIAYIESDKGKHWLVTSASFMQVGLCAGTLMDFVLATFNPALRIATGLKSHGWYYVDSTFSGEIETKHYHKGNRHALVTYYRDARPVLQFVTT